MEGYISVEGQLRIDRINSYKTQMCIHKNNPCGDHCPFFDEVIKDKFITVFLKCLPGSHGIQILEDDRGSANTLGGSDE